MDLTDDDIALANKRAKHTAAHYPKATEVRYDRRIGRLVIELDSGLGVMVPLTSLEGLEHARPDDVQEAQISPSGLGVHFPKIDADLYIPGLLEGHFGTQRWMAARNGRAGGKATSESKAAAARANGKLGGRPKKNKPEETLES